ncbi:N-alpha-acetyltransferase 15, NatA auxiliary subunit [Cichlidogyrus casuarinus]|uniref:N-alpha-acetyltransferase 15, NatA auxiliary subunit n=1 Tax=Cichlidogyrus casuarinus TaxID=1844966 RepID=A0ABD2Q785_9PLAT
MAKTNLTQILPPKEMSTFKRIVKFYDQKQYKTGLRFANSILSNPKYEEHGETLAMKAILLNCMGKRTEAYEIINRGLKANIKSFICWHIYGLIQKSDLKYDKAIQCYLQALRLEPENIQVLRDLSTLQMQMRNFEGARETRLQLLKFRPSMRIFWFGYTVTLHLLGNHEQALKIMDEYLKAALQDSEPYSFETSEIALYQVMIMDEANCYEKALELLDSNRARIVDITSFYETKADILIKMNKLTEALEVVENLLDRNSECIDYFYLLTRAENVAAPTPNSFTSASLPCLERILTKFPDSRALKRLMLSLYSGKMFVQKADEFISAYLRKGVPALFELLKPLYEDPEKASQLAQLYKNYDANLRSKSSLSSDEVEPPSTFVWFYYLWARHYHHIGEVNTALKLIRENLPKTPTLVDLYVLTSECYQKLGDFITASRWAEEGQSLDTADRYLNAVATRAMLKAHRLSDAETMASQFTHANSSAISYLSDMQCMWFLQETAQAYYEQGNLGMALKFCVLINKHFDSILDDQLDFHAYSLRKVTLRAYIDTMRLGDHIRRHRAFFDTARIAIPIYLHLHEHPHKDELDKQNSASTCDREASLSKEEKADEKRRKNKERKAAQKAEQAANRAKAEQERKDRFKNNQKETDKEQDCEKVGLSLDDPSLQPDKLLNPASALDEAMKFVSPLVEEFGHEIETHCLAFEIYDRRSKTCQQVSNFV